MKPDMVYKPANGMRHLAFANNAIWPIVAA
jgi:hypothetical protein